MSVTLSAKITFESFGYICFFFSVTKSRPFWCLCIDVDILYSVYKQGSLTTMQWDCVWA